jgi:formylglycine-generating enzyme required for sulfatase activity
VAGVTWFDAVDFCIRLSEREGLASPYQVGKDGVAWDRDAAGYRLPTEAEWEFAARAGEYTRFAGSDHANAVGWHRGNALELLQPVARKSPNGHGLYDMSGNVCEWVWDRYGPYAVQAENTDPRGPEDGKFRVQRGGSVYSPAADVRVARRHIDGRPDESRPHVGFRLARFLIS